MIFFPPATTPVTYHCTTILFGSGSTQQYFQPYVTPLPPRSVPRGYATRPGYRERHAYAPRSRIARVLPRPKAASTSPAPIGCADAPEVIRLSAGESGKRTKRTQKLHNRKGP